MTMPRQIDEHNQASWELKQLVKSGQYADEQAALRGALRALFQASPQAKICMVTSAYQAGDISLGKATSMLGVSQEEVKDILRDEGIEIHLGPQTVDEVLEDASHA